MVKCVLVLSLALIEAHGYARSLGVFGSVFPIAEPSLISLIEERLKSSATLTPAIEAPKALHLPNASQSRTHFYTPSVTIANPIRDANGNVLISGGTTINALQELPNYQPYWIFYNEEELKQRLWGKRELMNAKSVKVILTGGSIQKAEEALNTEVYFDQGGRITHQLHIHHVPARVTRVGNQLRIQEIALKENGDAT